jgi:hypothetical protein
MDETRMIAATLAAGLLHGRSPTANTTDGQLAVQVFMQVLSALVQAGVGLAGTPPPSARP